VETLSGELKAACEKSSQQVSRGMSCVEFAGGSKGSTQGDHAAHSTRQVVQGVRSVPQASKCRHETGSLQFNGKYATFRHAANCASPKTRSRTRSN